MGNIFVYYAIGVKEGDDANKFTIPRGSAKAAGGVVAQLELFSNITTNTRLLLATPELI